MHSSHLVSGGMLIAIMTTAGAASANIIDIDVGDSYPVDIGITSPLNTVTSQFFFNSTYGFDISDSSSIFNIDVSFNNDGTLNNFNNFSVIQDIDTSYQMGSPLSDVLASIIWVAGSSNTAYFNAITGEVDITVNIKVKFTGGGITGSTCETGAFTVPMKTAGYTFPYGSLSGTAYTYSAGVFEANSQGVASATITNVSCSQKATLNTAFSLGVAGSTAMSIYWGYPTYDYDSAKVHGS